MEGTVLANEDAAVDGYDVIFGKGFLQLTASLLIVVGLTIGWHEDSAIDDEEVGVGGWKAMTIIGVEDGGRKGEGKQIKI